jgi:glyoxylase-like metal-dependent hydrolase (beta-lactamase superfamily II)
MRALPRPAETKRFKVGDIECIAISDGHLAYMGPTGFLFGNAPQAELLQALDDFNFPADYWAGTYTCLVIKTGGRCILVDTGPGKAAPSTGHLLQNLQAEGIKPEDIDTVIITHAHPDHIGGIVDNLGKTNFPKARFRMWKSEWEFWTTKPDLGPLQAPDFFKFNLLIFNGSLLPLIASQMDTIDDEAEIAPGVSAVPLPGHTPGQIAVKVASQGEQLLYISDAVLHPIHLAHPEWLSMLDLYAEQTIASRHKLFEMVANKKTLLMGYHFDFPAMGRIVKKGDAWSWETV